MTWLKSSRISRRMKMATEMFHDHVPLKKCIENHNYRYGHKFLDKYVWANSADPEEQSDQGLHCLLFHLHLFDKIP